MTKFEAVCTLLDLKTKEDKLNFIIEATSTLNSESTNSVKTVRKSVAIKRGRKPGKKAGRPRKVKAQEEVNV